MKRNNIELGKIGERIATEYLRKKGYVILERNWRVVHLEVDIIAKYRDIVVFVEVKTRTTDKYGDPEEAVDEIKEIHLGDAAEAYIELNEIKEEIRFDIISIILKGKTCRILHIIDAFFPEDE
ncbi:MAG: YraN family protein [Bacteroidetes bacterium]|nr:YraN family protein [Bacteroidota bacterium]